MQSSTHLRGLPARRAYREIATAILREVVCNASKVAEEKQHFRRAVNFHEEVFNGGLSQYFTNSSGREYQQTLESLELIGAFKQREILHRCIEVLTPVADITDRQQVGQYVFGNQSVTGALKQLDKQYYASLEAFYQAMVDFAMVHKAAFEIE